MGLIKAILTAPAAPIRFVDWTARQVLDAAEREYYDPAAVRQRLAELSDQLDNGEITEEEFDRMEDELLDRLEEAEEYMNERQ
ncbi:gas vesicle protein GvpG [Streptomonospora nanhaiensis]|uniref:gas vesicle protein GvpG n=1 Tax=Streptomonospora nanhaiensis TaxID=1323731 RepID=UPI001C385D04|nr:gas vesicle protein GvpG [Streptomonospora nanhaiensis]MBV2365345.1 gas vesicle protein GvpG [Streptomonospora nanhaiensis]MBX9389429.1 gas vesicle protein GvpG [Streptomonospora nanhaiensis]